MFKLTVESHFSSAHRLIDYPGACSRIHGHNFKVKATIAEQKLDDKGMVIDLMELQTALNQVTEKFDHRILNEVPPFTELNPTSEHIAEYVYRALSSKVHVRIESVEVFESEHYSVTYIPET